MRTLKASFTSSVGRKFLMAVTGLALSLFVMVHLVGNLLLLRQDGGDAFNGYAHFLLNLGHGAVIYLAEAGLILFFGLHAWSGVQVFLQKRRARREGYEVTADAGGASRKTLASKTMILTGPVLLLFLVLHVAHFKYGPGVEQDYVTVAHGAELRDLYRLVVEEFNRPLVTFGYIVVMAMLGLHLRHGFWSAFQSLGATNPRLLPGLTAAALVVGLLLGFGFIYIPLHLLLFTDPATVIEPVREAAAGGLLP